MVKIRFIHLSFICVFLFLGSLTEAKTLHSNDHLKYWLGQLQQSPFILIRKNACFNLGIMEDMRALPYIQHAAKSDMDEQVRQACVSALGRLASLDSLDFLKQLYRSDTSSAVRREANIAISHINRKIEYIEALENKNTP